MRLQWSSRARFCVDLHFLMNYLLVNMYAHLRIRAASVRLLNCMQVTFKSGHILSVKYIDSRLISVWKGFQAAVVAAA